MTYHLAQAAAAAAKACGGPGQGPCHHISYLEAIVSGIVQGVSELFPISSLGHNVLLPALIGGHWADALNVSAKDSPYLAFVVGLHVATAVAMIAFFWRDWLRIIRGFFSSLRTRSVSTPDERLAWMIILATIPVGLAGLVLQKEVTKVFAKPELAALFLAVNGVVLLASERMRRRPEAGLGVPAMAGARAAGPAMPAGGPPRGYSQQPRQQQWQGPGTGGDGWQYGPRDSGRPGGRRYGDGQHGDAQYGGGQHRDGQHGGAQYGGGQHRDGQYGGAQYGGGQYDGGQYGGAQYDGGQYDGGQYEQARRAPGRQERQPDPWAGRGAGQAPDPWAGQQRRPAGQHGGRHGGRTGGGHRTAAAGAAAGAAADQAVAADRRLSTMGYKRAVLVGAAQIIALMPGMSRDGIVTVAGMWRGLRREDAVRFSFLLSAPVILAAGALKLHDLTGPMGQGSHGPMLVGAVLSGICAYLSVRFLTRYFSEDKSLNPFGIYCLVAGVGSLAYLLLVK